MTVYLNGQFLPLEDAKISVLDRGFIYGDGVYEVIPVYAHKPFRLAAHLERLENSLAAIRLDNPHTPFGWRKIITELIEKNSEQNQSVYLQVTRGVAKRDHGFPKDVPPTIFLMSNPLKPVPQEQIDQGIACISLVDNRWLRCHIKSTSLLANVLLRQEAIDKGAAEALLLRDGFLTEGSASNIFAVIHGVLLAPQKSHLLLPGITCDAVLDLAAAHGIPFETRLISETEMRSADELLLTSSLREVLAITTLDDQQVGNGQPGPMFHKLYALYQAMKLS